MGGMSNPWPQGSEELNKRLVEETNRPVPEGGPFLEEPREVEQD
jgi:hypothetical protein